MAAGAPNDSYLGLERRLQGPFGRLRQAVLGPIVGLLARLGVPPNAVSALQIALGLAFFYTLPRWPRGSIAVWLAALVCDSLDGLLARRTGRASAFGALWDQACDHTREILVVAALAHYGLAGPLWATLYAFAYPAFNVALWLGNRYGVPLGLGLKSYMVLYPALLAYLGWGVNWLDPALALSVLAMAVGAGAILWRLRRVM